MICLRLRLRLLNHYASTYVNYSHYAYGYVNYSPYAYDYADFSPYAYAYGMLPLRLR